MINALTGAIIAFLAPGWLDRIVLPFLWAFASCFYHAVFSRIEQQLFIEELRRRGRHRRAAVVAYYWTHYRLAVVKTFGGMAIGGFVYWVLTP